MGDGRWEMGDELRTQKAESRKQKAVKKDE